MRYETEVECLEIIDNLNSQLYDNFCEHMTESNAAEALSTFTFTFVSYGTGCVIEFAGIQIWDSENDERDFINVGEPEEDYEDLLGFVIRKTNSILDILSNLKRLEEK